MPATLYAAPVIPGPDGAARPTRPPALPSRLIYPYDPRVAYELSLPYWYSRKR